MALYPYLWPDAENLGLNRCTGADALGRDRMLWEDFELYGGDGKKQASSPEALWPNLIASSTDSQKNSKNSNYDMSNY